MYYVSLYYMYHHLQSVFQAIVQFHDSSLVATAIAVVGSTEDGHHIAFVTPVVSLWKVKEIVISYRTSDIKGTSTTKGRGYVQYRSAQRYTYTI